MRATFDGTRVPIRVSNVPFTGARFEQPQIRANSTPTADIQVTYNGFSTAARSAFEAAVSLWETLIVSSQTIHVEANWEPLGTGVLGAAGPGAYYLMGDDLVYPAATAEAYCGCEGDEPVEINAWFNSTYSNWYLGTDGNTPSNKFDFFSVVMHELGHGLGVLSSFEVYGSYGYWGFTDGFDYYPLRFDTYEYSAQSAGTQLISYYAGGSTTLKSQLTDGSVYFGGPNVVAALGSRVRLYAPATWSPGSSNSHLNESTYGAGNAESLMTPQIGPGESIHSVGPVTMALLRDIGWSTNSGTTPPPAGPANDAFSDATQVSYLPFEDAFVDNTNATFQSGEDDPSCAMVDATVWYRIQPTSDYRIRVRALPTSSIDPVIAVHEGVSLDSLTEVACVDAGASADEETAYADLANGSTYYIQVGGYFSSNTLGEFTVKVRRETATPPPTEAPGNDNFANATNVPLGSISNATTTGATLEPGEPVPSCAASAGKTVWYRYTPTTTRTIIANTVGSGFDTVLAIYTGGSLGSLTPVKCNDDRAVDRLSKVKFKVFAGQTYYFQVAGYQAAGGSLVFRLKTP